MIPTKRTTRVRTLVAVCSRRQSAHDCRPTRASGSNPEASPGGMFRIASRDSTTSTPPLPIQTRGFCSNDLRPADDLSPTSRRRRIPARARGGHEVPAPLARRQDVDIHAEEGLPLQRRQPVRASAFVRAIARTLDPDVESPALSTRGRSSAPRTSSPVGVAGRRRRTREPTRRPLQAPCARLSGADVDALLLRRATHCRPTRRASVAPRRRPLLHRRVPPETGWSSSETLFYRGNRPHHVDGFLVDLTAGSDGEVVDRTSRGRRTGASRARRPTSTGIAGGPQVRVKGPRFWVKPGLSVVSFVLNTSRGIFRTTRVSGGPSTSPTIARRSCWRRGPHAARDRSAPAARCAGFRDARIYLRRPDLRKARTFASGHLRGRKAVLYMRDSGCARSRADGAWQLEKIGLDVEVKPIPPEAYPAALARRDEPWDIAFWGWSPDYIDPYVYINLQLDSRFIGTTNAPRFNSPKYTHEAGRSPAGCRPPPRVRPARRATSPATRRRSSCPTSLTRSLWSPGASVASCCVLTST